MEHQHRQKTNSADLSRKKRAAESQPVVDPVTQDSTSPLTPGNKRRRSDFNLTTLPRHPPPVLAQGHSNSHQQNNQTKIEQTFAQYQQLRGNAPRKLSGADLRNEIGMAMTNSSLGFMPNNAPRSAANETALDQGKWDLFNADTFPENFKNLPPEQQEKAREQFKNQQQTISTVENRIREIGGENAQVTTLPITVDSPEVGGLISLPLFRVLGKDGRDHFVDEQGRVYESMQDWKENNKLPPGKVSYFKDGQINDPAEKPNLVTENTHAVVDTPGEHIQSWAGKILPWVGMAAGGVLMASGLGAPIGAPLLAASTLATVGVAGYGISQGIGSLRDRATHGQSWTDLQDAEVRDAWLGLTADALSMGALGSAVRMGKGGLQFLKSADEIGGVGRALNGVSAAADATAMTNSTITLAQNWDKLSPEQRLLTIGQLGFWGTMTGVGAVRSGGAQNQYGAKDLKNFFGSIKGQKTGTPGVPEAGNSGHQTHTTQAAKPLEARVAESGHNYRSNPELRQEFKAFFGKKRYAEYAKQIEKLKLTHPELQNIPTEDLVAVRGYTSSDYRMLNKALRSGDPSELARLNAYIKTAESGLSQLPSYEGSVFRGTNLSPEAASKYVPGEIVTEEFFFSTAANPNSAFSGDTKYFVESIDGKRVEFLSEYPHEREVLFPPGTKFEVLAVEVDQATGQREIFMNEIPKEGGHHE